MYLSIFFLVNNQNNIFFYILLTNNNIHFLLLTNNNTFIVILLSSGDFDRGGIGHVDALSLEFSIDSRKREIRK